MTRLPASRARKQDEATRRALWALIGLTAVICAPSIFLISQPSGPDLFDLTPVEGHSDGFLILAWPELERPKYALRKGGISSGTKIRALGYMMDSDRHIHEGERVQRFVLLPDAGN